MLNVYDYLAKVWIIDHTELNARGRERGKKALLRSSYASSAVRQLGVGFAPRRP
jgi:hypothetical protein